MALDRLDWLTTCANAMRPPLGIAERGKMVSWVVDVRKAWSFLSSMSARNLAPHTICSAR